MMPALYHHPFSSYSMKAKTAFYEKGVAFVAKIVDGSKPVQSEFATALGREADDGGTRWRGALDTANAILDKRMEAREWAAADRFSMADCAAAPHLLYADWCHPIGDRLPHLWAYRERLLARESFARPLDEARPYRANFPLGAREGRD